MDKPPLGLAYLSAYLKSKGYEVDVLDLNIELFKKEYSKIGKLWEEDAHMLRHEKFFFKILYPEIFENEIQIKNQLRQFFYHKSKKNILKQKIKQFLREKEDKKPTFNDIKRVFKENINFWAKKIFDKDPDLIGFSINGNTTLFSLCVAKEIKKINPKKHIVFGGTTCHRDINAKFFLETGFVDAIVTGEGEIAIEKIAQQLNESGKIKGCPGIMFKKEGKIIDCGNIQLVKNLDILPFPDYDSFNLKNYVLSDTLPFLMSRGCPYNCNFCLDTLFWKKYRFRSVDNMIKEFKQNYDKYGIIHYGFNDLTINANLGLLSKFTKRLAQEDLKIKWSGTARFVQGITKDLLVSMKNSGCEQVDYGLESASESVLKRMHKPAYNQKYASEVLKWGHEAGMRQALLLIIGYVNETEEEFNETLNFVLNNKKYISEVHAGTLYLLKGVPLYENHKRLGIYLKKRMPFPQGYEFCEKYHYQQYDWRTGKQEDEEINRFNRLNLFYKKLKEASIEHNLSGENLKKIMG